MQRIKDETGHKYGRLTVLNFHGFSSKQTTWFCKCDCGKTKIIFGTSLRFGHAKSCGCLQKEIVSRLFKKHGYTKTRIYRIWRNMKTRCYNPNHEGYKYYGARGIKVCDRWHSFSNFLSDMGKPPDNKTLDRMNNDKDYMPNNCRWATWKEQANNRRNRRMSNLIVSDNNNLTIIQWANKLGLSYNGMWKRIKKWPLEKALTIPIIKKGNLSDED